MLFAKQITYSSGGSSSSPSQTFIKIRKGVIARVWISFPAGCAGLTKLRLYIDEHPFIPIHKDAYIRGDNYTFEIPVSFEVKVDPARIKIEGWNEDDTYDHTIDVYVLVLDKAWILPVGSTEGILAGLKELVLRPVVIKQIIEGEE